ncbi:DUF924 family protein [Aliiroseovarius sp. PTFE2010]|uniref:DUF924 family protein n=1 Tax=Aliiroseovarius sp. PTFE2010 TaxID=3417190 RepID=UPI003CF3788E
MADSAEILSFWLDEVGPEGWYNPPDSLDAEIRDRFGAAYEQASDGAYSLWLTYASGALAYVILLDQFPRNMFRGQSKAFAADGIARTAAKAAIAKGWDLKIDAPARQFFYLPLMHSENLTDQDRCVRLVYERLADMGEENLRHARAHREVIRQFGRFPFRNDALGRPTTAEERRFLDEGGYENVLQQVSA